MFTYLKILITLSIIGCCNGNCSSGRTCMPIERCSRYNQILNDLRRCGRTCVSSQDEFALKNSFCGFNGLRPRVCCPNNDEPRIVVLPGPTPTTPNSLRITTDPRSHPSFNLLPTGLACGRTMSGDRIVGGENARFGDWPWMALLIGRNKRDGYFTYFCGGTLINDRYVLTAAHCITKDGDVELLRVRLGEYQISKNPDISPQGLIMPRYKEYTAEDIILHSGYSKACGHCNDIGLIRLDKKVDLERGFIDPVCLPYNLEEQLKIFNRQFIGKNGIASGWGVVSQDLFGNSQRKDILQQVAIPLHNLDKCSAYNVPFERAHTVICGGTQGKDTCRGDSGGPLVMETEFNQRVLVGITSLGPKKCGQKDFPAVYTDISGYMNWILDQLKP